MPDFCWLNKTWSVEKHSAFQTLKINPSKLSNLKDTHQVHPIFSPVGFSTFWRVPYIVFANIAQKKLEEIWAKQLSTFESQNQHSEFNVFLYAHWILVVSKSPPKNPLKNSMSISWIYPPSRIPVAHEGLVWDSLLKNNNLVVAGILGGRSDKHVQWLQAMSALHLEIPLVSLRLGWWLHSRENDPIWSIVFWMGGSTTNHLYPESYCWWFQKFDGTIDMIDIKMKARFFKK